MTTYIKLSTLEYPRHIGDIKIDLAGMSDYAIVEWVDRPTIDQKTQRCFEQQPVQVDGVWQMTWAVRDATAEEIEIASKPFTLFDPTWGL
jgi:hypothetical protein